jgi:GAF domain-containing protein
MGTLHEQCHSYEWIAEIIMTTVSPQRLAQVFVEVSDTLVDDFDLIDFLQTLAMRTAELAEASVVGIVLADQHGQLQFMAASQEDARLLELFQLQNDEGPCLDAFRTMEPVANTDLGQAADRWPRFAPHAVAAGYQTVHAFPLRLRAQAIGALNIFGAGQEPVLAQDDMSLVQSLADMASIALLQERAIRRGELLTEQLQGALNSRVIIEQAKGALAQSRGVTVDEAFQIMRSHARSHNQRLSDIARAVITNPEQLPTLLNLPDGA